MRLGALLAKTGGGGFVVARGGRHDEARQEGKSEGRERRGTGMGGVASLRSADCPRCSGLVYRSGTGRGGVKRK